MPGLATAHSHAFQRALRGRTQRKATAANSFWSWRGLMYKLAETLTPDDIYAIARLAYAELAISGVTAVGEFHYLHHDNSGRPYANRTETAEACIRAALDVGIRICLIRTAYVRGGFHKALDPAQLRFVDADINSVVGDVDSLQKQFADNPLVTVAVAAHSVRAVPIAQICELSTYAAENNLPFHMHICEQRQELQESIAEHGMTPVQLLAEHGVLGDNFVGIHATHLSDDEIQQLGKSRSMVCLCRTTERDLGDGVPRTADLVQAGVQLCVGVDSHVEGNAFEEVRAVELDERLRLEARHAVAEAPQLLEMATRLGYVACGMGSAWQQDQVTLLRNDLALTGLDDQHASDGVVFGASPRSVRSVTVGGEPIIENGEHFSLADIVIRYRETLKKLGL